MQLRDGRLWLSPSDLNAFRECEHLTRLELEVARGSSSGLTATTRTAS